MNIASCVLRHPKCFRALKTNLPLACGSGRDSLQSRESMTEDQKQKTSMRMEENKNRKTRKGVGRKPKTDPAVYRYVVRLNSEENVKFDIQFQKSGLRERSKFIKAMIFGKEIKVVRIDKATMDYYVRLTNFYHQFQAIGNNYNQTVKAIKNNFGEKRAYALLRNLEKTTIDLVVLSKRIIMLTHEFEETYLIKKQREEE